MRLYRVVNIVTLVCLSSLFLVVLGVGASEQERAILNLPESVNIQGNDMLLGEIAEIAGPQELVAELAAVNAGAAPRGGSSRRLTKGQIEVRLRQAGLDLTKIEFQGATTVQVFGIAQGVIAKTGTAITGSSAAGFPTYEVVVATRDLSRGEVLSLSDLTIEERELRNTQPDGRSLEDFVGLRTTRHVIAGTALTTLNVERIPAVERGAQVTIVVRTPSLAVTAPGIARGTGGVGEVIAVENTLSKQVVYGEIIDAEIVQVNIRGSSTP